MFALFNPQGPIAAQESELIKTSVLLMLFIVIPLLVLFFTFARKYRTGNPAARRASEEEQRRPHRAWRELVFWAIPAVLVVALGMLAWRSAHALDPSAPIAPAAAPLTIQVVALPWKWLFIYPAQNIATVNFVQFPAGVPVHFTLTADAPMSSFWIPQLGSQIYAMAAMMTQLNLEASTTGEFVGKDTEINGAGYAGMTFIAKATTQDDFDQWVAQVRAGGGLSNVENRGVLDQSAYAALVAPSEYVPPVYYASVIGGLFNTVMMKDMVPSSMPELW